MAQSLLSRKSVTTMLPPLALFRAQMTPRRYGATHWTPLSGALVGTKALSGQQDATTSPPREKSTKLTHPSLWPTPAVLEVGYVASMQVQVAGFPERRECE